MSGMIRRLRWKIVGISMLFVTLVLAAVFTGVMLTARSSLEQSSTRQLEKALRGEGYNGQNGPALLCDGGLFQRHGAGHGQQLLSDQRGGPAGGWYRNACPSRRRAAC